jgi:hypothetical protein
MRGFDDRQLTPSPISARGRFAAFEGPPLSEPFVMRKRERLRDRAMQNLVKNQFIIIG